MRPAIAFLFVSLSSISSLQAQKFLNSQNSKKYSAAAVLNTDYGIVMYQALNKNTGGDSLRLDYRNVPVQGWLEDYYENGKLLHRGNYVDGRLNVYKNYYENGQLERSFEVTGLDKFYMEVFYADGKKRSLLHYKGSAVQKEEDFYPNGKPDFIEEYSRDMEYVVQRKSWYESGQQQDVFELTDPKKKIYMKREYYESGKPKEEGTMVFNREAVDYMKDGIWKSYDESGKLLSEDNYALGTLSAKEEPKEEKKKKEKKAEAPKTTVAGLPAEFKPADKDKDGKISALEINAAIDAFFDDKGDYTPEKINRLIDYFFEQ